MLYAHVIGLPDQNTNPKVSGKYSVCISEGASAREFVRLPLWSLPSAKHTSFTYERVDGGVERQRECIQTSRL